MPTPPFRKWRGWGELSLSLRLADQWLKVGWLAEVATLTLALQLAAAAVSAVPTNFKLAPSMQTLNPLVSAFWRSEAMRACSFVQKRPACREY